MPTANITWRAFGARAWNDPRAAAPPTKATYDVVAPFRFSAGVV